MARPHFLTEEQWNLLLANGKRSVAGDDLDPAPVVKLFTPDAGATWLLTEVDPDDEDIAFGLCDLGLGCPELGSVRLSELLSMRGRFGLPVERDLWFKSDKPISVHADLARQAGRICDSDQAGRHLEFLDMNKIQETGGRWPRRKRRSIVPGPKPGSSEAS
ncbi:DUF2958 domain-containing protein [Sandarakinorhabdus rubra]